MVLDGLIMQIAIIVIVLVFIAVANQWIIAASDRMYFDYMVKMPKFVDRPDATLADYSLSNVPIMTQRPGILETYSNLRYAAMFIMAIIFIYAMIAYIGENFGMQRKGQAIDMISKSVVYTLFLLGFPVIWDALATGVEMLNVYILNPANPTPENAAARAKDIFIKLGGINTEVDTGKVIDSLGKALVGNFDSLTQLFHDITTSVFRAFISALIFLLMIVIGTIRQVLTAATVTGMSIILVLKLVPWTEKIGDRLLDTLVGLVAATIVSAIVVVTGAAYLDTLPKETVEQNFVAFVATAGVVILSIFMPVMLAPMLGSVISSITGMVTSSLQAGVVAGGATVLGAAKGAAGAVVGAGGDGAGGAAAGGSMTLSAARIAGNAMQPVASGFRAGARSMIMRDLGFSTRDSISKISTPFAAMRPPRREAYLDEMKPVPIEEIAVRDAIEDGIFDELVKVGDEDIKDAHAIAHELSSEVFALQPEPLTAMQKLRLGAKGAFTGSISGMAQGLGNSIPALTRGVVGMTELGSGIQRLLGRFDADNSGTDIDIRDVAKGFKNIGERIDEVSKEVKAIVENKVGEGEKEISEETKDVHRQRDWV